MFSAARPADLHAILAAPAYRRAVGSLRIFLACWLVAAIIAVGLFILHLPQVLVRALVIVHVGAWVGGLIAALRGILMVNRLAKEFPDLTPWSRLRRTLVWMMFRDAVIPSNRRTRSLTE
jgi:hypothetical protein